MGLTTPYVLAEVSAERDRQDAKWGEQNHNLFVWSAILTEETGEVAKAAFEWSISPDEATAEERLAHYREEAIQTAAVAVAIAECLDRNRR